MNRISTTAILVIIFFFNALGQQRVMLPKNLRSKAEKVNIKNPAKTIAIEKPKLPPFDAINSIDAEPIGETFYDLQTNSSSQNRIYLYNDGTIGGTWTMGMLDPNFSDRGTGYNFYDGIEWDDFPLNRIESVRTGWPSYGPYGSSGEMVISHDFSNGSLLLSKRDIKGTGNWMENYFNGPENQSISWNRSITSGSTNSILHCLALTWPTSNGGQTYQGLDGAILYSKSNDGGLTWNPENNILNGMNSSDYFGFAADNYEWAEPKGDILAFLVGSTWTDLFFMKSMDGGNTWTKTIIWDHPYPLFNPNNPTVTDTFYCPDGAHSITIDNFGNIHVAFGINRAYADGSSTYWFEGVGGIGYWNEEMDAFSSNMNALSPYGDPGTELIEDYNLIGWTQDINNNGTIDVIDEWGLYYLGFSSMPQLISDDQNNLFLIYASVTETYDNGNQNYRHLWARGSNDNGQTWGDFLHVNEALVYIFSECVFPSCSPTSDDYIHLIYQVDDEPGLAVRGDLDPYGPNIIEYLKINKSDIITIINGGSLSGTVTDAVTGFAIEDALIDIENTYYSATTQSNGNYSIVNLPTGNYVAVCQKVGYAQLIDPFVIIAGENTILDFQLAPVGNLPPPLNLQIEMQGLDAHLNWQPPDTINEFWLHHDNQINYTGIGMLSGTPFEIASHWEPDQLTNYDGYFLSELAFYINDPVTNLKLKVWSGTSATNLLIEQNVTNTILSDWNYIEIENPVQIDASEELWFGFEIEHIGGYYPAGADEGPAIQQYGDMINTGTGWQSLYAMTGGNFDYNWNLAGLVTNNSGEKILASSVKPANFKSLKSDYPASASPNQLQQKAQLSIQSFLGYNLYKNDEILVNTTDTFYIDSNLDSGFYEYYTTALYTDGESSPSNMVYAAIPFPCYPPQDVLYAIIDDNQVQVDITPPGNGEDLLGFNIYINSNWVAFIQDILFISNPLLPGTYTFCVTTVCDDGESDPDCSDPITISYLAPPTNLEAELLDNDVYLSWIDPYNFGGNSISFNIYRNGILIGGTTSNTYLDENIDPGEYEYCVMTYYNGYESECSNTALISYTLPCNPIVNLTYSYLNNYQANISWDPPSGSTVLGYNIYRDNVFLDFTTATSFETDSIFSTTEYCITTVCENGESEPICIVIEIEDPLFPPLNLIAWEIIPDILLEWSKPSSGSPDGYNIYYSFESGGFSMIAYVTDTVYFDYEVLTVGLHEYYVTAVYGDDESEPSNTVSVLFLGCDSYMADNIKIFPNPVNDKLHVQSNLKLNSVKMYDMNGTEILNSIPGTKHYLIHTTAFSKGLYLIFVESQEGTLTKRIIIR